MIVNVTDVLWLCVLSCVVNSAQGDLLNAVFAADIGHTREARYDLVNPFPMNKSAFEGAFSLWEGLFDFVTRQQKRPTAAFLLGDVMYGGGGTTILDDVRAGIRKYANWQIEEDRVFVAIGNHDVHYLGCTEINLGLCYYGTKLNHEVHATYEMNYSMWQANWLNAFPGMKSIIAPPTRGHTWQPPGRYNVNLDEQSSVYFIIGLNSGSESFQWNAGNDTPPDARDAAHSKAQAEDLECTYLRDSLAHGRFLGKSIFVYMTHHFQEKGCNDWTLLREIDIWIYGHKHNGWMSTLPKETVMQEQRHFPIKLLIGNGGFDEGKIDVVSFAHVTESLKDNGSRVSIDFDIRDTCISDEKVCPDEPIEGACWKKCKDMPGGYNGGGGPRMATPSKHNFHFQFEAPRKWTAKPSTLCDNCIIELTSDKVTNTAFLYLGPCVQSAPEDTSATCVRQTTDIKKATIFHFYDSVKHHAANISARIAVETEWRGALATSANSSKWPWFYNPGPSNAFWFQQHGAGRFWPSVAHRFNFVSDGSGWRMIDVAWQQQSAYHDWRHADALAIRAGSSLRINFKPITNQGSLSSKKVEIVV